MSTIFNRNWDSNEKRLFLGQELGLADYVNVLYPELEKLALNQRSQYWIETEISLENDKKQWPLLPEHIRKKTKLNLGWQTMADSFITRAPENAIMKLVSRPELEGMLIQWSYFENIHSRAYSNIIRNVLPDPSEFIDSVKDNEEAFARIAMPVAVLDELAEVGDTWLKERDRIEKCLKPYHEELESLYNYKDSLNKSLHEAKENKNKEQELIISDKLLLLEERINNCRLQSDTLKKNLFEEIRSLTEECQLLLLKAYFAIYGLEAMMFYASFACTFALAENDILSGIAKNLQLIAKDEALHTVMSKEILQILFKETPAHIVEEAKLAAPLILREILKTEINWAHYIFPDDEPGLVGLNAELLVEYLYYIGRIAFQNIGVAWPEDLPIITKNPIPWINFWIETKNQQPAPQEIQLSNYRVGQTAEASDDDISKLGEEFGW